MNKLISFLLKISPFLVLSFLTIGYAVFTRDFQIEGIVNLIKPGKVEITSIVVDQNQTKDLSNYGGISIDETTGTVLLDFDFNLSGRNNEKTYSATYLVSIENNSPFNYTYTGFNLNPNVTLSNNNGGAEVSYSLETSNVNNTLSPGSVMAPGEKGVVAVKVNIKVGSKSSIHISVDGEGSVETDLKNEGELLVSMSETEVDLRGNGTIDCFDVSVINTYDYSRNLAFSSSNNNFSLVNESGSALDVLTIGAPDENDATSNNKTYNICMKVSDGATFVSDTSKTTITVTSGSISNMQVGNLNVLVDKQEVVPDDDKPPVINVKSFNLVKYDVDAQTLTLAASWDGSDANGTDIDNYYVDLYDENTNTLIGSYETGSSLTSLNITLDSSFLNTYNSAINTNNHNFYIKVYGEDALHNSGSSYCSQDTSKYCVKSSSISLKYQFTIKTSGSYTTFGTNKTAYYGNDYTISVSTGSDYNLPGTITVKYTDSNESLTNNTDYVYSVNGKSGSVKIYAKAITNNISINVTSSSAGNICLVEGTKVKLANGSYKNIEDITYTDLLAVYSHEQGRVVYEYPVWIENSYHADEFQRTYFSDGTYLDTYASHGIFSMDDLKYVSVLDYEHFHEGTKVVKIDDNNKVKIVTVLKQKTIKKFVNYYHVSSVRYHNIIANDILTTDAVLEVSNMYSFNKDITWGIERDIFLNTAELWDNANLPQFPPHIFKGFRGEEIKFLYDQNKINLPLYTKLLNGGMVMPYQDENGNYLWAIGTSDSDTKLYKAGSMYTVPYPKNRNAIFVGWYNTGDNKYYKPGDTFKVDYSMYLEAMYK